MTTYAQPIADRDRQIAAAAIEAAAICLFQRQQDRENNVDEYDVDAIRFLDLDAIIASVPVPTVKDSLTVDDERERFEAWCVTQGWVARPVARENGTYVSGTLQARWHAWQAAKRDALTQGAKPILAWANREGTKFCGNADKWKNADFVVPLGEIRCDALTQAPQQPNHSEIPNSSPQRVELTDAEIDQIADDGHRNAAGGIYATSVHDFARALLSASKGEK